MRPAIIPSLVDDPIISLFRKRLAQLFGLRLSRLVLFGSRARGDAEPESDYDFAVFLEGISDIWRDFDRLAALRLDMLRDTGAFIEAIPFSIHAWGQRTPLMHEIRRDGIEL